MAGGVIVTVNKVTIYIQSKRLDDKKHIPTTFNGIPGHFESNGKRVGGAVGNYFEIEAEEQLTGVYVVNSISIPKIYKPVKKVVYDKKSWTFVKDE